ASRRRGAAPRRLALPSLPVLPGHPPRAAPAGGSKMRCRAPPPGALGTRKPRTALPARDKIRAPVPETVARRDASVSWRLDPGDSLRLLRSGVLLQPALKVPDECIGVGLKLQGVVGVRVLDDLLVL